MESSKENVMRLSSIQSKLNPHDASYAFYQDRFRRHVIIEINNGNHFLRSWNIGEVLKKVLQHQPSSDASSDAHFEVQASAPEFTSALTYRDCKQMLSEIPRLPSIEVRKHCISVCFPPVTCFILHDRVFLCVVEALYVDDLITSLTKISSINSDSPNAAKDVDEAALYEQQSRKNVPFEFVALEIVLKAAFTQLNEDLLLLESKLESVTKKVETAQSSVLLDDIHYIKTPIGFYEDLIQAIDKTLDELINNYEDLKRMELTRHYHNASAYKEKSVFRERIRQTRNTLDNTDRWIGLRLSLTRNRLILLDLASNIFTSGLSVGALIAGIFGMNLLSGVESSHSAFILVSSIITTLSIAFIGLALYILLCLKL